MRTLLPTLACSSLIASMILALAGCGGGGGGGSSGAGGTASLSGTISVPATAGPIIEAEPNGTVDQAHFLGSLLAGQTIQVSGQVSGSDLLDGFRVVAPARVRVSATLSFDDSTGNEFDLGIWDAIAGDYVEYFPGFTSPASGNFHAQGTFYPVVLQFVGAGAYTLTLTASTPANPIAEREPNTLSGEAQYLGDIQADQIVRVTGTADSGSDVTDRYLLAVPADIDLAASLAMPLLANFDVIYADATLDLFNPIEIVRFDSLVANPETGSSPIPALTLLEVTVLATSGTGAYTLTLTSTAADDGALAPRSWAMAPLAHEARRRAVRADQAAFGLPVLESMPGELLVLDRPGLDSDGELARRGLGVQLRSPSGVKKCVMPVPAIVTRETWSRRTQALAASLGACGAVEYAEANLVRRALDVPNDPFFNLQWHYTQLQLPAAWDLSTGDNAVRVAVIDTGETQHPDLVARQVPGFDFISNVAIAGDGDGIDPDPTDVGDGQGAQPSSFHGTHVAGTIGASSDNGVGVAGVTWAGEIMHLRVLGIGGGSDFDIAESVRYAARLANVSGTLPTVRSEVINMSLGGAGSTTTMQNAVTDAFNAGVVIFAAAGNENSATPSFPASYTNVVSVAAVDFNAVRAPYSNFNAFVDLAAPGGDVSEDLNGDGYPDGVLSTLVDDGSQPAQFVYAFYQGTSMACPHAAGVAALMLALTPSLTPAQVENFLITTATDLGAAGRDDLYGHGLINAYQAVLQSSAGAPVTPVLGLSTQTLSFALGTSTLNVQVSNLGGGLLDVATPVVSTNTGGNWLSAALVPIAIPTTSDTSAVTVSVDRTGLADGLYTGSIDVPSNGGTLGVQVSMSVDTTPTPENINIYVVAVDASSGNSIIQDVVNPAVILDYSLPTLPAGSYYVVAGSDDDNDGFICGPLDRYCGVYPTLNQAVALDLIDGQAIAALDFSVQTSFQGSTTQGGRRKFRLLR